MSTNDTAGNATIPRTRDDFEFRVIKIILYFFILTCSTCGNVILIYIISSYKKMRTPSNMLILNLAISDLLTPLFSIPFDFALEENDYVWIYGALVCKLLWPLQTFFSTISSLILAAIALDRYRILMHPFTTRLTGKQIKLMLIAIYLFCGAAMVPYCHVLELSDTECAEKWPAPSYRKAFTVCLFLIQYAIPLFLMIVMYSMALWNLCKAREKMRSSSVRSSDSYEKGKTMNGRAAGHGTRPRRLRANFRNNPNAKATKMFIIIVVVFAIFMFPNQAVWLWAEFGGGQNKPIFSKLAIVCWLFTYTNSVVNPVIFRNFSKEFRSGFKVVLGQLYDRICFKRISGQVERARRYMEGNISTFNTNSAAETTAHSADSIPEPADSGFANTSATWSNGVKRALAGQSRADVKDSPVVTHPDKSDSEIRVCTKLEHFGQCIATLEHYDLGYLEKDDLLLGMEKSPETPC